MAALTSLTSALLRRPVAQVLVTAVLHSAVVAASSIWVVDIDNDPAPSPEDSPPFSRNALRDTSALKYQIIGIVGAYLATVVLVGLLLLTYGRAARRIALANREVLVTEMVKPTRWTMRPSPISPGSASGKSWRSWTKRSPSVRNSKFSATQSITSVDPAVLEADKAKRQQEMERIYAAVLDDNQKKSPEVDMFELQRQQEMTQLHEAALNFEHENQQSFDPEAGVQEVDAVTGQVLSHRRNPSTSSRSFSQRRPPPRLDTASADSTRHQQGTGHTPGSSASDRTRSPPMVAGTQTDRPIPTFPISDRLPDSQYSPEQVAARSRPRNQREASSGSNKLRKASSNSVNKHLRNITISAPMPHGYPSSGSEEEDREASRPLSPRQDYTGRPPSPPTRTSTTSPTHAAPVGDDMYTEDEDIIYAYGYEGLDSRRPIPHAAPHRNLMAQSHTPPLPQGSSHAPQSRSPRHGHLPASPRAYQPYQQTPQPPSIQTQLEQDQVLGQGRKPPPQLRLDSSHALPLRQYQNLAQPSTTSPTSPISPSKKKTAPTPTKTTFLSPRREHFPGMVPLTGTTPGGLPAGWTALSPRARAAVAGPATPYSPYMPRTPMTPITPRLVTKADRKARAREQAPAAITEEEEVKKDGDIWGDGYS